MHPITHSNFWETQKDTTHIMYNIMFSVLGKGIYNGMKKKPLRDCSSTVGTHSMCMGSVQGILLLCRVEDEDVVHSTSHCTHCHIR